MNEEYNGEHTEDMFVVAEQPDHGDNHIKDREQLREGMLVRKIIKNLDGNTFCGKNVYEVLRLYDSSFEARNIETDKIEFLRYDEFGLKSYKSPIDGSESWDKRNHLSLQFQD